MTQRKSAPRPAARTTPPRNTRAAILRAAMDLMGREGITALTAGRLAAEAGVSKATVFHHFSSIEAVPNAAFDLLVAELAHAQIPEAATLTEALSLIGRTTRARLVERRDVLRAYFSFAVAATYDPEMQGHMAAAFIRARRPIAEALAAHLGAERGGALATRLIALLDGAVLHSLVAGAPSPVLRDWDEIAIGLAEQYG